MDTTTKQKILAAYEAGDEKDKQLLASIHGEKFFRKSNSGKIKSYTDIETIHDALEGLGFDRNVQIPIVDLLQQEIPLLNDKSVLNKGDIECLIGMAQAIVITRAANKDYESGEEWKPDWNNSDQRKYFPVFDMRSGFGFSGTNYAYWHSLTTAGSRLSFKDEERTNYIVPKFLPSYKKIIL